MDLSLENDHVTRTSVFDLYKNKLDLFNKIFKKEYTSINCKLIQESVIEIIPSDLGLKYYHGASIIYLFLVSIMHRSGCRG